MRIATSGLVMNSSYTVWWVVFNNPSACVGGCGADDLSNPAVRASVLYAAGFVTGLSDTGNVTAHLEAGAVRQALMSRRATDWNPETIPAEVHLVVRSHGLTLQGAWINRSVRLMAVARHMRNVQSASSHPCSSLSMLRRRESICGGRHRNLCANGPAGHQPQAKSSHSESLLRKGGRR